MSNFVGSLQYTGSLFRVDEPVPVIHFANGSNNLIGDLFYWHHPKQSFAFCHCRIDEAGADVGDVDMAAALVSLFAQGFHVVDLIGFRCAVGWSHRLAAQSACRGDGDEVAVALLLKDLVERINDERPAYDVGVDGRTLLERLR